jgi:hypothetical protein
MQVAQRVAQFSERQAGRPLWPEQLGQVGARVRPAGLHGQASQQGPSLSGQSHQLLAVQLGPERSQQVQAQGRQGRIVPQIQPKCGTRPRFVRLPTILPAIVCYTDPMSEDPRSGDPPSAIGHEPSAISHQPAGYLAYMLRLRRVMRDGQPAWLASVESPHTGERQAFCGLEELFGFLLERTEQP